nr:hypothetical protein Iba_chr03cCG7230 [Ipomoea batatas]
MISSSTTTALKLSPEFAFSSESESDLTSRALSALIKCSSPSQFSTTKPEFSPFPVGGLEIGEIRGGEDVEGIEIVRPVRKRVEVFNDVVSAEVIVTSLHFYFLLVLSPFNFLRESNKDGVCWVFDDLAKGLEGRTGFNPSTPSFLTFIFSTFSPSLTFLWLFKSSVLILTSPAFADGIARVFESSVLILTSPALADDGIARACAGCSGNPAFLVEEEGVVDKMCSVLLLSGVILDTALALKEE